MPKGGKKGKTNKKKKAPKAVKSQKKLIKAVVEKMAEHKVITYTTEPFTLVPGSNSNNFFANIQLLSQYGTTNIFDINQGTGQADRIGNKIRIVKAHYKGIFWPLGVTASVNTSPKPQDVRLLILKLKSGDKSPTGMDTAIYNALFQSNNASTGPDGTLSDIFRKVNTDVFTVYLDKYFKCGSQIYAYPLATSTASLPMPALSNATSFGFSNNDYKLNNRFDIDLMKQDCVIDCISNE